MVNIAGVGIVFAYSELNLRPFLPPLVETTLWPIWLFLIITFLVSTVLSALSIKPLWAWLRGPRSPGEALPPPPQATVERGANLPFLSGILCLGSWLVLAIMAFVRIHMTFTEVTPGLVLHIVIRPLLAGLIASTAVIFASEYLCRTHLWPVLFRDAQIQENERLFKFRVAHRFFLLWAAISFLPLSTVAFTAYLRIESFQFTSDPVLWRVMVAIILISVSAAIGGAWLAWLVSRSMVRPLRILEGAMEKLRGGEFSVRVPVSATGEISALEEGFNLMAGRLADSYETLEARNLELAEALDHVAFLESVKRGLDRFVSDTVRRIIEENPDSPDLQKRAKDVTVLFLDIEGYSRLSEELPREKLTQIIERFFSSYLTDIRAKGGDINETAGDGLMILFQKGEPEEHAASAARTAIAIREKTAAENRAGAGELPPISVNVGISSGECDVGSTRLQGVAGERWTFTATGPVTNLAARLGDRAQRGQILLGPGTAGRVRGKFRLNSLGEQNMKNLAEPVEVWEVLPSPEGAQPG
jgi:class 3 adenylate cyclase/HAMP domain-containing protein